MHMTAILTCYTQHATILHSLRTLHLDTQPWKLQRIHHGFESGKTAALRKCPIFFFLRKQRVNNFVLQYGAYHHDPVEK